MYVQKKDLEISDPTSLTVSYEEIKCRVHWRDKKITQLLFPETNSGKSQVQAVIVAIKANVDSEHLLECFDCLSLHPASLAELAWFSYHKLERVYNEKQPLLAALGAVSTAVEEEKQIVVLHDHTSDDNGTHIAMELAPFYETWQKDTRFLCIKD